MNVDSPQLLGFFLFGKTKQKNFGKWKTPPFPNIFLNFSYTYCSFVPHISIKEKNFEVNRITNRRVYS